MNILLTTVADGETQVEETFTVGVYRRTGPEVQQTEFGFFTDAADGGAQWDGNRLRIYSEGRDPFPSTDLDLIWHPDSQTWTGLFGRGQFHAQVVLKRPTFEGKVSRFVGTWFKAGGTMNTCLHVAQQRDGGLTGWADDIQSPASRELHGEIARAEREGPDWVTVELRAYIGVCCPHKFATKISPDGMTLSGAWFAGANQAETGVEWKKMPGNSCRAAR